MAAISLCAHMASLYICRDKDFSFSSYKATNPILLGLPPLRPHLNLITSLKALAPYEFMGGGGGHKSQSTAQLSTLPPISKFLMSSNIAWIMLLTLIYKLLQAKFSAYF